MAPAWKENDMDRIQARKAVHKIIDRMKDEDLGEARKLLEDLLVRRNKPDDWEEEELSESELLSIEQADDDIRAGRGKSWQQVKAERSL
jgi:hypothetical protein